MDVIEHLDEEITNAMNDNNISADRHCKLHRRNSSVVTISRKNSILSLPFIPKKGDL